MSEIPEDAICEKCLEHKGEIFWVGQFDSLNASRFMGSHPIWCHCCALREQVRYAERLASLLPQLREELAKACVLA